ncbi:MAG: penicillin acylase family protein [Planctomycetota bacterium]|nr:MAG: penicillin acylase family protein [Planctomycetota bacterium]
MSRRPRLLLLLLLLGAVAAGAWGLRFLHRLHRSGLPVRSGRLAVRGLLEPVRIRYDAWGVPHVRAGNPRDLAFAAGWVQANDRLGQLELVRRAAFGRLAELFGTDLVARDRRMRSLGLDRLARRLAAAADDESRRWATGFADGVNAWVEQHRADLPPLFVLTGTHPEPWTPADSMAVPLLMGLELSFAFGPSDENRFLALCGLDPEEFADLWPGIEPPSSLAPFLAAGAGEPGPAPSARAGGSNNWALAPTRTATGAPLFANDPHLDLRLPSLWYELDLRCPGYEAVGMALVGVPCVVIGHNADLAWGFTNLMLDDHDLLFEEVDESGGRVRRRGGWAEIEEEECVIQVRGGEPTVFRRRFTPEGPLLPADETRGLPPRTLLWTGAIPGDPLAAFLGLGRARSLEEARRAAGLFTCPAQNLVAVDRAGGLLHTVLGRLPRRRAGDGRLPAAGADPAALWDGLEDPAAAFVVRDPPEGILVTANHDVRPPGWNGRLSADFDLPFRAERIRTRLRERTDWTAADLTSIQTDVRDLYALEVVRRIGDPELDGDAARALAALRSWNGERRDGTAAALFLFFERELAEILFADRERQAGLPAISFFFRRPQLLRALAGEVGADWWDDLRTEEREDRDRALARALDRAWRRLAEAGEDPAAASWGDRHRLVLHHPLGAAPLIGGWFDRGPFPLPGSATTVAAFGGEFTGDGIEVSYGPSFRFVADPADWDRSRIVLPGGQSGHPADPHYDDQIDLYLAGRTRAMPWSEAAVAAATTSEVLLEPRP